MSEDESLALIIAEAEKLLEHHRASRAGCKVAAMRYVLAARIRDLAERYGRADENVTVVDFASEGYWAKLLKETLPGRLKRAEEEVARLKETAK